MGKKKTNLSKPGRKTSIWTKQLHKRYLMFFPQSMIKDPRKSYTFTNQKHQGIYKEMSEFLSHQLNQEQIKSYNQRVEKSWKKIAGNKSMITMVCQQLQKKFVLEEYHEDVQNLLVVFCNTMRELNKFVVDSLARRNHKFMNDIANFDRKMDGDYPFY